MCKGFSLYLFKIGPDSPRARLTLPSTRDLLRLGDLESLEVEDALVHMVALTGCVILFFLLLLLLVKCGLYPTWAYPGLSNLNRDIEVRVTLLLHKYLQRITEP